MTKSLKITGNTFQHREAIKALGGQFDGVTKTWTVADTPSARDALAKMIGTAYREESTEFKPPLTPNQSRFQRAFGKPAPSLSATAAAPVNYERMAATAVARDERIECKKIDGISVYGQSEEYLHHFPDAKAFAGFDSLEDLTAYIEALPTFVSNGPDGRDRAWRDWRDEKTNRLKFTGTADMPAAIAVTRNGWSEGVTMARKVAERITGQMPTKRKRVHAVAGGSVNVGRMLSGNPLHMRQRAKQPSHKVITLINNTGGRFSLVAEILEIRAAVVAAIADTLENNGYSCEIVSISKCSLNVESDPETGKEIPTGGKFVTSTKLKAAGDRLNLSDVMFGLGHPSMTRRFQFAIRATFEEFAPAWDNGMGYSLPIEVDEPNTFVIQNVTTTPAHWNKLSFDEKLSVIVAAIVPENLPLEFKFNA